MDWLPALRETLPRLQQDGQAVACIQAEYTQTQLGVMGLVRIAAHLRPFAVAGHGLLSPFAGARIARSGQRQIIVSKCQKEHICAYCLGPVPVLSPGDQYPIPSAAGIREAGDRHPRSHG